MRDVARKFAIEEIIPKAAHYDKTGEVNRLNLMVKLQKEYTHINNQILF